MILKRYVKFENGAIYDNNKRKMIVAVVDGLNYFLWEDERSIVCLAYNFATADDIWELITDEWFWTSNGVIDGIKKAIIHIFPHFEKYSPLLTETAKQNADLLYAPITENGSVVRYEKVWER